MENASPLDLVADWIADASNVSVLTGAGISTDSGIPDFRGPQGLWTRDPAAERRATIDAWRTDPELRREAWRHRAEHRERRFAPNDGHRALAQLERLGRLDMLVTQNVDGLHQDAGTSPERVIEIHGTLREAACLSCGARDAMDSVLDRVSSGEEDPHCEACGGLLKSATISFGQALVEEDIVRSQDAAERADVFLALGTSLAVYPAAYLPVIAAQAGGRVVIVNGQPTEMDEIGDVVLHDQLGEVLPALVTRVRARLGDEPADDLER